MNYLNTNESFIKLKKIINDFIYVDKSIFIDKISRVIGKPSNQYVCITRPRRFGKTINANMLAAYYTKGYDSHELFDDLKIAKTENYEKHMNKYNVIYIDFSQLPQFCHSYDMYIYSIYNKLIKDICTIYKLDKNEYDSLNSILKATNDSFIFILDEWDSIFYKVL